MKNLEAMKSYIREHNFTCLVNELVTGADMSPMLLSTSTI